VEFKPAIWRDESQSSQNKVGPITEADGFEVGNEVRSRGPGIGTIRRIFKVGNHYRALIYWPTKPHTGEKLPNGQHEVFSPDCEQNVDLAKLTKVIRPPSRTETAENLLWRGYCECMWDETRSRIIEIHPACCFHAKCDQQSDDRCWICGVPNPCNCNDSERPP
jgi:hypothetical protein